MLRPSFSFFFASNRNGLSQKYDDMTFIYVEKELISKNNDKKFSKKFAKETTYNSIDNNFELNKYKKKLEKNLTSQILQDMNIFLGIIGNDI